jgi:DNA polymerase IV
MSAPALAHAETRTLRAASRPTPFLTLGTAPNFVHVRIRGFFASVEQAVRPKYRGKPVIVGQARVVSASYEAELLGITTGMSIKQALELCPNTLVVGPHYDCYAEYAEYIGGILENFCPAVDPDGLHGFYVNFFGSPDLDQDFPGTLRRLQLEVVKRTGLYVSIGAGKSKVVAAIGSGLACPRGLRVVAPGTEAVFLASLPVGALHGIGPIDAVSLRQRGISTIGDLRRVPLASLEVAYGGTSGRQIWNISRGLDIHQAPRASASPSLSREITIDGGTTDVETISALTEYLCERVGCALRDSERRARILGLHISYVDQLTASQSLRLSCSASGGRQLLSTAQSLLQTLFTRSVAVRSLTVSLTTVGSTCSADSPLQENSHELAAAANS